MSSDLSKWFRSHLKQQVYRCEYCLQQVVEGTRCEGNEFDEDDKKHIGSLHISPKRTEMERGVIERTLKNIAQPTPSQFAAAAQKGYEVHSESVEEVLRELAANNPTAPVNDPLPQMDYQKLEQVIRDIISKSLGTAHQEAFTKTEAAEFLRLSVASIEKLIRIGELRKRPGIRKVLLARTELIRWLNGHLPKPIQNRAVSPVLQQRPSCAPVHRYGRRANDRRSWRPISHRPCGAASLQSP